MIRRTIAIAAGLVGLFGIFPLSASAHVLETNNGVSSVLHIPPSDAPEAGMSIPLEFDFGSDRGTFHISDYQIQLTLSQAGRTILQQPIVPAFYGSADQGLSKLTFPKIGVYDITVHARGINDGASDFSVDYSVRVATAVGGTAMKKSGSGSEVLLIGGAGLILFIMVATRQIVSGGRYKATAKTKHMTKGK